MNGGPVIDWVAASFKVMWFGVPRFSADSARGKTGADLSSQAGH